MFQDTDVGLVDFARDLFCPLEGGTSVRLETEPKRPDAVKERDAQHARRGTVALRGWHGCSALRRWRTKSGVKGREKGGLLDLLFFCFGIGN